MFKSILKIAFRNIWREKYYTAINVMGLALGFASCLLIYSYVNQQLSYDNIHPDIDRLYRVNQTAIWDPKGGVMPSTCIPLAQKLMEDYDDVQEALRINTPGNQLISYEQGGEVNSFFEDNILAVDSNFFTFFGFELAQGDERDALRGKNKVVLSEEAAKRIFGEQQAMGKTLLMGDNKIPIEVTGVAAKQPDNVHFHFDYLLSINTNPDIKKFEWSWIWTQVVTYIKVKPGTNVSNLESKFTTLAEQYVTPMFAKFGIDYNDFIKGKGGWNFYLQPVDKIHLYSGEIGNRIGTVSDIKYVYIFSMVGIFILLLAAINFINLSTARGAGRAKEVGIKKTLGSHRSFLVFQFQFETVLLSVVATILGLGIVEILKIIVNILLEESLTFMLVNGSLLFIMLVLGVGVGLLAGIYPSLYLTSFKPIEVLKGKLSSGLKKSSLRNGLVIGQFIVSISFLVATIIVYQQLNYFSQKDLGFDKEQILVINHADKLKDHLETFKNELKKQPGVTSLSVAMDVPGRGAYEDIFMKEGDETQYPIAQVKIDENYLSTLNMKLAAGRTFEEERLADKDKVIINETTARMLGWTPEESIGKRIIYLGDDVGPQEIIGVVQDFHFQSLNMDIAPLIFFNVKSDLWGDMRVVILKFNPESINNLLSTIEKKWETIASDTPFEYSFLNEEWSNKYKEEKRLGGLFAIFTVLSLIIALIGMIGLVTYSSEQRKKEIGIRKTLGASTIQMVFLLSKNFIRLVIISFAIAVPLSWYGLQKWLEQFPYRIELDWKVFVFAGLVMVLISWITISYQSIKTALTNPTDVLKDE